MQSKFSFVTHLAFLAFLHKFDMEGLKKFQEEIKLPPVGIELTTLTISLVQKSNAYPVLSVCHTFKVSDCQTPVKSWFIEFRNDPSAKSETKFS